VGAGDFALDRPPRRVPQPPGSELVEAVTLVLRADDWWTAWSQFFF
jgi:hypothetical protein